MNATITITKLDAARRQLRTAIDLWFRDGDPVAIHTLAAASYQIIHDLNRRNKGPDLFLDSKFIKDKYRKTFKEDMKYASNFMKHADRGKSGIATKLNFNPGLSEFFMLYAIFGLIYFKENLTTEEEAFKWWQMLHKPELLTKSGQEFFHHGDVIEDINDIRTLAKPEFLECFYLSISHDSFPND